MKKLFCFGLLLCCFGLVIAFAETHETLPEIFRIQVESVERRQNGNESAVYKEYLKTANTAVNEDIAARVEAMDAAHAGNLMPDPAKKGNKNSRLDIGVIYYRTGEHYLSTMVFARDTFKAQNNLFDYNTVLYDLQSGERIRLSNILSDTEGFRQEVLAQLSKLYPGEAADHEKLKSMAVDDMPFTMSAMELTIHIPENLVYPDKKGVLHARFYYPKFSYFNALGKTISDNSRWKFIALTFDDGPKEIQSTQTLNAIRNAGARVSYFTVGTQLDLAGHIAQRQASENHILANHTYKHWNGYTIKTFERRLQELDMVDQRLLYLVGEKARYFRAPGGVYPPWAEAKVGAPIIQWSIDTYDYTGKSAKKIFYTIRNKAAHGDIVLMHDTGHQTHKAVPRISEWLTERGYMMVTLDELAAAFGVEPKPAEVYWSFREGENRESKQK